MGAVRIGMITFDCYLYDPRVRRLAEAAVDAGYRVDVICLRRPQEKRIEVCEGVHIYRMPLNRGFGVPLPLMILGWGYFLLLAGVSITWLHLKHRYEVIQVHNMPDFLIFSALVPKLFGAKLLLDVQDVSPELIASKVKGPLQPISVWLARWQEQISIAFADHVLTTGWPFEKLLVQRGVRPGKLTSILNSADAKFFPISKRQLPSSKSVNETQPFILMYHGTIAERQGLDIAVRAVALACRVVPHLRLDMKGHGEHLPFLKRLCEELGISDKVMFSEWCPYANVVDFVANGNVGIIPYRYDGFMEWVLPTKAYEFAWMHRPIIASDTPAMRSMFRRESVALCDPSNPESFAEAIIELYQQPEKCASMVSNAAEDYTFYSWEIMRERYQKLLASLRQNPSGIGL